MEKCLECHSTLKHDETVCFTCGSAVRERNPKPTFGQRFSSTINVIFIISVIATVSSLFPFPFTPPFSRSMTATIVLLFVKSSAEQMLERKKG